MKKEELFLRVKTLSPYLINIRRRIHKHPELGFKEYKTTALIKKELKSLGIPFKAIGKTGVVAYIKRKTEKPCIAIRADIDALPIEEKTKVSYKSKIKGLMHACGHDVHTAILLGAAKILSEYKDKLNGSVKLIFQPAEEIEPSGALKIIKKGFLKQPNVDFIYALHVHPSFKAGEIEIRKGPLLAACLNFKIKILGKGSHGAEPEKAKDPIKIGSMIIQDMNKFQQKKTKDFVISITKFNAGYSDNIIPDDSELTGTIRTKTTDLAKRLKIKLTKIIKKRIKQFKANCNIEFYGELPAVINDPILTNKVYKLISKDKQLKIKDPGPLRFAEDFSFYIEKVPGLFILLGTNNKGNNYKSGVHTPTFNIDESALCIGTYIESLIALNFLGVL